MLRATLSFFVSILMLGIASAQQPLLLLPSKTIADAGITLDYPIVYVESPRTLPCKTACPVPSRWAEFGNFAGTNPGTNLAMRWPDGTREILVEGGAGDILVGAMEERCCACATPRSGADDADQGQSCDDAPAISAHGHADDVGPWRGIVDMGESRRSVQCDGDDNKVKMR